MLAPGAVFLAAVGLLAVGLYGVQFVSRKKKVKPKIPPAPEPEVRKPAPREWSAQAKAREIILEARDEAFRIKKAAEEEARKARAAAFQLEKKLTAKEEAVERKIGAQEERERQFKAKDKELEKALAEVDGIKTEQLKKLEKIAHLTRDEAKKLILTKLEEKLKEDVAKEIREAEARVRTEADKKAKELLVDAMQKAATDYVAEYTVSTVKLSDEDMKGRIIGREGRNIRTLERVTGVDFDIDETPGEIRLSCFDPVRREVAKVALQKLIADGRIQPARIEETVAKTKQEIEKIIHEEGEKLCRAVGVYDLPKDKVELLGRFKYRFSYGQNMITHTLEETKIGVALAHELGADVNIVRLGCLLHDIGKVITDKEGTHVELGVNFLKRNNMPQKIVDCVAEHHQDRPFSSIESVIVYIADAISGARPGARLESLEEYTKRLSTLEDIAKSFKGVEEAFAISAGRELRVVVKSLEIDDAQAVNLAQKIKEKIEEQKEVTFPGQVKVTVIRETRATEIAT
jgi:ribonuclease Y